MSNLSKISQKIFLSSSDTAFKTQLSLWKSEGKTIVFSNGCFDLLHRGHIEYLAKTADVGNVLIVGLNTDASVSRIKGADRPIQDEHSRAIILAAISFIDAVVLFDEDTPYNLIKEISPNCLVKGADYKTEDIVGYDIVTSNGGQVVTIDLTEGYSTSNIIERIKK